ncbi:unnamed protein product [Eruca vesicaria subsp. sativa]|uniref:Uncharacterized protein n=1 Tax=Eruca vesicaria subsp. sativa TaxID=29727 RepID=A0ABC8KGN8_ERUVS|nr:unnamed protein product [Eruca vesicaria subsp. sativa]
MVGEKLLSLVQLEFGMLPEKRNKTPRDQIRLLCKIETLSESHLLLRIQSTISSRKSRKMVVVSPKIAPSMLSSDFANLAAEAKRMDG